MKDYQPLVSIVVITYNSSKYVLETLESAKKQTYPNIELIVTDDCSTDNTVEMCREWLEKNAQRFVRVELVISNKNTGIPANSNRGCKKAKGEWIKNIAGDDVLLSDCIQRFVESYRGDEKVVAGCIQRFYEDAEKGRCYYSVIEPDIESLSIYNATPKEQFDRLLKENFVYAPSVFIKRELFSEIGFYEEQYCMLEDYPFWLKYIKAGYKIGFINILIVYYRCNDNSLTSNSMYYYNKNYYLCESRLKRDIIYPMIPFYNVFYWQNELVQKSRFIVLFYVFHNRRNAYSEYVNRILSNLSIEYQINKIVKFVFFLHKLFSSCRNYIILLY